MVCLYFAILLSENVGCEYSFEACQRDDSYEYIQPML